MTVPPIPNATQGPDARSSELKNERAVQILAQNIYREFRSSGFAERDVMRLAGELLALVTSDVRERALGQEGVVPRSDP